MPGLTHASPRRGRLQTPLLSRVAVDQIDRQGPTANESSYVLTPSNDRFTVGLGVQRAAPAGTGERLLKHRYKILAGGAAALVAISAQPAFAHDALVGSGWYPGRAAGQDGLASTGTQLNYGDPAGDFTQAFLYKAAGTQQGGALGGNSSNITVKLNAIVYWGSSTYTANDYTRPFGFVYGLSNGCPTGNEQSSTRMVINGGIARPYSDLCKYTTNL